MRAKVRKVHDRFSLSRSGTLRCYQGESDCGPIGVLRLDGDGQTVALPMLPEQLDWAWREIRKLARAVRHAHAKRSN